MKFNEEIKSLLMQQEYFTAVEDVEKYLVDNEVSEGMKVQTFIFDKETFSTVQEVMDWLASHGYHAEKAIDETSDSFRARQIDPSDFEDNSFRTIDIRKGIKAVVGKLRPSMTDSLYHLSLRNEDGIKLSGDLPHIIELAKVVNGIHPTYGEVVITKEILQSFVKNFSDKVTGVDVSIDYDHEVREAAGWLRSVFLSFDGETLLSEVKWTPKGAQKLSDREFRYFSPEFTLNFVHPHTGVNHGATLLGGALVNRPFLKMDAIVTLKEKGEINMSVISLKDHEAKLAEKDQAIEVLKLSETEAKKAIDGQKEEIKKLSEKVSALEAEKANKEKEEKHSKLFSDGKINKAQLEALNSGKELYDVLSLSDVMNTSPKGTDGENNDAVALSEKEILVCENLGLTKEEYVKYNK